MANRFWVGGTATWDGTAGSKWSTTSGGGGGAAAPTNSDDVFFNGSSGSGAVTVPGAGATCRHCDFTGFTGSLIGTGNLDIRGNLTIASGMTWTFSGQLQFRHTSGTATITSNGKVITAELVITGVGGTTQFADAFETTASDSISILAGTLTGNGQNITFAQLYNSPDLGARVLNLGSGTWSAIRGFPGIHLVTTTNFTFNANTSTIKMGSATGFTRLFEGGGRTFNNVWFTNTDQIDISGSNTFNDFKTDQIAKTLTFADGTTTTIATADNLDGASGNVITLTTPGSSWNIAKSGGGTAFCDFLNVSKSQASPASTWFATNSTDGGSNTGWSFPVTHSVDVAEAGSAADSVTRAAGYAVAVTESRTSADTVTGPLAASGVVSESGASSDAVACLVSFAPAVVETCAATDAPNATQVTTRAVAEAGAATDSVSMDRITYADVVEAVALSEATTRVVDFPVVLADAGAVADSTNMTTGHATAVAEAAPAADVQDALAIFPIGEVLVASDAVAAQNDASAALSEALVASDSPTGSVDFTTALSEVVSPVDVVTGLRFIFGDLVDVMPSVEVIAASLVAVGLVDEGLPPTDAFQGFTRFGLDLNESAAPSDAQSASYVLRPRLAEDLDAEDDVTGHRTTGAILTNFLSATDSLGTTQVFVSPTAELVTVADLIAGAILTTASVVEVGAVSDVITGERHFSGPLAEAGSAVSSQNAAVAFQRRLMEYLYQGDQFSAMGVYNPSLFESLDAEEMVDIFITLTGRGFVTTSQRAGFRTQTSVRQSTATTSITTPHQVKTGDS